MSRKSASEPAVRIAQAAATVVFVVGLGVLSAWCFDLPALEGGFQQWPRMAPLTALGFALGGFSLFCITQPPPRKIYWRWVAHICAGLVALLALLKLGDSLLGWNLRLDLLGFHESAAASSPAEMSPMTALGFLFLAGALVLGVSSRLVGIFQFLALSAMLIGCMGIFRYLYEDEPLWPFAQMSLPTAVSFFVLSCGVFCARTDGELISLLLSDSMGGLLARRLLLPALLVPVLINFCESMAEDKGWINLKAESSLFTATDIVIFGALVWIAARLLHRSDLKRRLAEQDSGRLGDIVASSDDAIISKTLDGIITSWNHGAEKLFGYSGIEAVGKPMLMIFPADRVNEEPDILARIARGESVEHFETVRVRKDGKKIDVSVAISPLKDQNGRIVGASKIARDISDRKQSVKALHESEEKFRQLAENINEVFWATDPRMKKLSYVSPAYERIWGRTCQSLYDAPRAWLDSVHPEDRAGIVQAAEEKLPLGQYDVEYRIVRPDKEVRWIHDRGFPVRDATGEIYRIVGTAEDITARKKIEAQFRQAQKMESIGQLAGGVAHDFNNLLAVIQMYSDSMQMSSGLSSDNTESVEQIGAAVQRAAALTRQLLLFSRREIFQPSELDLSEAVTNTLKMLRRTLGENINVQVKLASQPLFVHADASMMDQVLLNLAVNARDAMPQGGHLVIETSGVDFDDLSAAQSPPARVGSFVRLGVSDTGCGIPPEILPKIFEPFFTTKEVGKGTGLGLATVFGIVQQHQGWVNVYSEVGHGTTFRIYIPRLAQYAAAKLLQTPAQAVRGRNEIILLVEDEPSLRASVKKALSDLGYRVIEAPTGAKALEIWKEKREEIVLLLTDLVMPDGVNGKELAERLLVEKPQLKVVYMSGYSADVAGKNLALKEGGNFLTKPFQTFKLAQIVRDNLDAPKDKREKPS